MRRRVQTSPAASSVFGTLKGAPRPFQQPEGTAQQKWDAWVAWEDSLHAFLIAHPQAHEGCDEVLIESIPQIPDKPFNPIEI